MPKKDPDFSLEAQAWKDGHQYVAGVDEAGRGPLAGPVVVAAVILGREWPQETHSLQDSKRLTPRQREHLFDVLREEAIAYEIVAISSETIDRLNILQATFLGMRRAVDGLSVKPEYVLVDGNQFPFENRLGEAVVKGDQRSLSIAAASILAKVTRDRVMVGFDRLYPQWGFKQHKGYPTVAHRKAVAQHGLSPVHRQSFRVKPVQIELPLE